MGKRARRKGLESSGKNELEYWVEWARELGGMGQTVLGGMSYNSGLNGQESWEEWVRECWEEGVRVLGRMARDHWEE